MKMKMTRFHHPAATDYAQTHPAPAAWSTYTGPQPAPSQEIRGPPLPDSQRHAGTRAH